MSALPRTDRKLAYHFVGDTLRDGRPVPAGDEWLEHEGKVKLCASGLHWSADPFDALQYAPGNTLCLVEYDGETKIGDDKGVSARRRILKRIDAEPLLREFARWSALQVIELWDAPEVVRQYLTTGDESLRDAARDAAVAAAVAASRGAARDAAWAAGVAARDAAGAAAVAAQRERFNSMVRAAFEEA